MLRVIAALALMLLASGGAQAQTPASQADRILVVGTKEAPPFAMKAKDGTWSGISIDLWRKVADQLHLRYRLEETSLQGLIDDTAAGRLDAAVAALTVTKEREQAVDFSQPFFATGLGIAVPKTVAFDWFVLLKGLVSVGFLLALLALLGVTILVGVVVWLIERRHSEHFGGVRKGLVTSVWWSALTMTQAGSEHEPTTFAGRLIAVGWMTASVIAIATFTAGITSQLTTKQLLGMVHGVDDLKSVRVGAVAGTSSLDALTKRGVRFRTYDTPGSGLDALKAGALDAFVYDRPMLSWYISNDFGSSLQVLDTVFDKQTYAIAVPNDSPLRVPINLVLLDLVRSQWFEDLNTRYLGKE